MMTTTGTVRDHVESHAAGPILPGLVMLLGKLAERFGANAIRVASPLLNAEMETPTVEVVVDENVDEASQFVTKLTLDVLDQHHENYAVILVSPQ